MSTDKPSAWAMEKARRQFRHNADGELACDEEDIATALDAAREEGRRAGLEEAANAFPSEGAVPGVPVVLFADAIRARIRALATKEPA